MADQGNSFNFSPQQIPPTASSVGIVIRVVNNSSKITTDGTVGLQDGKTGDSQYAGFGEIGAHGGSDERGVVMNGSPDAMTVIVEFNAGDGTEWKGNVRLQNNLPRVDINLND
jgi:hypothetical protein